MPAAFSVRIFKIFFMHSASVCGKLKLSCQGGVRPLNNHTDRLSERQKRVRMRRLRRRMILCAPPVLLALVIGFLIFRPPQPCFDS